MTILARPLYTIGYTAYFELNIDTIIENYCVNKEKPQLQCNGKCHLAKQLSMSTAADFSTAEKSAQQMLVEVFLPVFIAYQNSNYFFTWILDSGHKSFFTYANNYFFACYHELLRPPKI